MSTLKSPNRFKTGFTLVEMIVVIAINTLLFLVIMEGIVHLYQTNAYTFAQANEVDSARRGVGVWVRDAREMTSAADGTFPLGQVSNHEMGFYSDVDRDSNVEYVRYRLSSTTLYKLTYKPTGNPPVYNLSTPVSTTTLSEYVQNISQGQPTFRYYDANGALIASPSAMISDIQYITINMIVNIDPLRSPGEFMLKGSAAPRNLKDNL